METTPNTRTLEEKAMLSICIGCILCVLGFGLIRAFRGEWHVVLMDGVLASSMGVLWYFVYKSHNIKTGGLLLSIALLLGTNTTIYLQGSTQVYWFFPAMAATYYFTPLRNAIPITILAVSAASFTLYNEIEMIELFTFIFNVMLNNTFAYIFVSLTRSQRTFIIEQEQKRILWLQNLARFLQHELKNTMIGFRSSIDLIERKNDNPSAIPYIERARHSLAFMSLVLTNVGDASALEATISEGPFRQIDLDKLVSGWLQEQKAEHNFDNYVFSATPKAKIVANELRMRQLLEKLVSNARSHAVNGSNIRLSITQNQHEVILCISNQGPQLPENAEGMFELFVSLRADAERSQTNIGVGLYVAKLICDAHNAKIVAENNEDGESVSFAVHFPLYKGPLLS